jgi:hypothetical protein
MLVLLVLLLLLLLLGFAGAPMARRFLVTGAICCGVVATTVAVLRSKRNRTKVSTAGY